MLMDAYVGEGGYQKCLRKHFESKFDQNWKKNIFNLLFHELFESISKCQLNTSYLYKRNIHGLSVNCSHKSQFKKLLSNAVPNLYKCKNMLYVHDFRFTELYYKLSSISIMKIVPQCYSCNVLWLKRNNCLKNHYSLLS